jgi:hypothetical protein
MVKGVTKMRYDQINQIEIGDCLEIREDYEYKTDFSSFTISKGSRLVIVSNSLSGFTLKFLGSVKIPFLFSKKRLYKMKMRKIGTVHL